jgi:hypothetical protein
MIVHKKKTQSGNAVVEKEIIVSRTRPVRIAAMRQREMMAIIVSDDINGSKAETQNGLTKTNWIFLESNNLPKSPQSNRAQL